MAVCFACIQHKGPHNNHRYDTLDSAVEKLKSEVHKKSEEWKKNEEWKRVEEWKMKNEKEWKNENEEWKKKS